MHWEVSLSNGETFNDKQLYKEGDVLPFRRLIRYAVENGLNFTSVKVIINGVKFHLPTFTEKAKFSSDEIPDKWWFQIGERFAGAFGKFESEEKVESISYIVGKYRHYFIVDDKYGNVWERICFVGKEVAHRDETILLKGADEEKVDAEWQRH